MSLTHSLYDMFIASTHHCLHIAGDFSLYYSDSDEHVKNAQAVVLFF